MIVHGCVLRWAARLGVIFASAVLVASIVGCAAGLPAASGDGAGVTTGGQQDIAAARTTIESGGVPDPASISVEGFLSEHGIPVTAPADAGLLFTTATVAWNKDFDAFTPLATVQVGFGSTIDEATFERRPQNLCLVIDVSGSMAEPVDVRSGTSKIDAVKIAVDRLLGQLDGLDKVSIVTFTTFATTRLEGAAGNDAMAIKTALDDVEARSGTSVAAGMRRGFQVTADQSSGTRADRLLVFTDALLQPVAQGRVPDFVEAMQDYADDGIGATIFGVGIDFGHEVAYEISQVRGGSYFFLSDYDRIVSVFDEDFDFLVTPVAYDVELTASIPIEFDVEGVYGIPVDEPLGRVLELNIPTLFLSNRQGGGAILIRVRAGALVDFEAESTVAEMSLAYNTPEGGAVVPPLVAATMPAGLDPSAGERYFETDASRRAVLLLNTALVLKNACADVYGNGQYRYWNSEGRERAVERLTEFLTYFDNLSAGLEDRASETSRSLSQERALVERLLANIR